MTEGEVRWVELTEGSEFAGYRIERRLGRGGMGIVYLAVEPGLDRRVALKLVAPDAAVDEVFRTRFTHESKIAASIEHPNVVPIYAAGEEDGIPFIAMRYVSGSDLNRKLMSSGRLEPARATALIEQVAAGLDAIHAVGLVHRDVKPANVLLSGPEASEHAYITDFGVARNVASTSGLTKTGRFVGTLDYVAPEQIRGGEVDARADVYALGCLLFKLLTGEVPFPREGEAARLYAHLNDEPPAASLFTPMVPKALDRVIARAMAKSPDDRFPSAGDLGRAAVAALSGEIALPERTVATGAAATRTAETPVQEGSGEDATTPMSATAETGAIVTEPVAQTPQRPRSRRKLGIAIGAVAAVAVAAAAIALGTSGGGGDASGGQANVNGGAKAKQEQTLSEQALARKAGEICLTSQDEFVSARSEFPNGETDINEAKPFSRRLTQISAENADRLARLNPPPSVAAPYKAYLRARRRVHRYDIEAHTAALRGDLAGFQAARQKNFDEGPERHRLAKAAGITPLCSPNPNPNG